MSGEKEKLISRESGGHGATYSDPTTPTFWMKPHDAQGRVPNSEGSAAVIIPGVSLGLPTTAVPTHTNENDCPGPTNIQECSAAVCETTENTPRNSKMVTTSSPAMTSTLPPATGNNENRKTRCQYWRQCTYSGAVCVIIIIDIVITCSLLKASSSSSTLVFPGDVVQVSSINRFWYNQARIKQQPPEGVEQAEATIYLETCVPKECLNETTFPSRALPYAAPQGLYNLQQQYLLAGSDLVINLTTHAPFDSDASAKVCQFSNADDYDELLEADTKAEVDEAERNGYCQAIEPPSGTSPRTTMVQFDIHSHGYYYYALAVVPGELMNISYIYTLSKHYYDKNKLTPYNCSVVSQDCAIDGLKLVRTEVCVLALISAPATVEPSIPYTFHSEQTRAGGIAIVFFCVASLIAYCVFISTSLCCANYERKYAKGVV